MSIGDEKVYAHRYQGGLPYRLWLIGQISTNSALTHNPSKWAKEVVERADDIIRVLDNEEYERAEQERQLAGIAPGLGTGE